MAILLRFSINYYVELPLVGQAAMEKLEWPEWVDSVSLRTGAIGPQRPTVVTFRFDD